MWKCRQCFFLEFFCKSNRIVKNSYFNKCKYFLISFDIIKLMKKMKPVDTLVRIGKTAA